MFSNNKVIEFNGDFWHANPLKNKPDDKIGGWTKVKDIWLHEELRIKFLKRQNYKVLVVWEAEYTEDKEKVLEKCYNFLIS